MKMTASCTNNYCSIQIVFWMRWKKQHCLESFTKRKYIIIKNILSDISCNNVEWWWENSCCYCCSGRRGWQSSTCSCKDFQSYHDCTKTWFRREGLPLYIWKWFVCYKCSLNGYNVRRHIIAVHGQEASRVACGDCDAISATNAAHALGKQITFGI